MNHSFISRCALYPVPANKELNNNNDQLFADFILKEDIDTNLQPAIDFFKNQTALAKALKLDPMAITQWKKRGIPPHRAIQISKLTGGFIKPSDLKPKLFGDMSFNEGDIS